MLQRSKATDQASAEYQAQALMDEAKAWALLLDGIPFREAQDALIRVVKGWTSDMFGLPKPGDVLAEVEVGRKAQMRIAWAERQAIELVEENPDADVGRFWYSMSRRDDVSQIVRDYAKTKFTVKEIGS